MTFICSINKHVSEPGDKRTLIVTQTRPKSYSIQSYLDAEGIEVNDAGGESWEIVKEEPRCPIHI